MRIMLKIQLSRLQFQENNNTGKQEIIEEEALDVSDEDEDYGDDDYEDEEYEDDDWD